MPGTVRSSTNRPWPVRSFASSLRATRSPIALTDACPLRETEGQALQACPSRGACRLHRADDVVVAGAAAEVALERVPDLLFRRARVLLEDRDRGQHHARRAEAAL